MRIKLWLQLHIIYLKFQCQSSSGSVGKNISLAIRRSRFKSYSWITPSFFFPQQTTWNNSCACYHAPTRHHHTALSKVLENTTTHTYYYHISPPVGPFLLQGESMGNESPAGNLGCRWGYTDRTRPHSSTYGPRDHCVCVHTKEVSMCVCAFRIVTWERLCMCVTMRMR